jgi:serine O-acetyltransferase
VIVPPAEVSKMSKLSKLRSVSRALEAPGFEPDATDRDDPARAVLDALCAPSTILAPNADAAARQLPSREAVAGLLDDLRGLLFPAHFGAPDLEGDGLRAHLAKRLDRAGLVLAAQVRRALTFTCAGPDHDGGGFRCGSCDRRAAQVRDALVARLPAIRDILISDVRAAFAGDPAAQFIDETLLCYPGVAAITQHRIAHELFILSVPLIPRIIADLARATTGIDIHPGARIGPSFFIDHGTGVVIGETCAIGAGVRLYQGVTLGARGFPSGDDGHPIKGVPRHPIVEDGVVIYAGATILGRITIGRGAVIGGNVWLTRSVAPGARVTQAQVNQDTFEHGAGI